MRPATPEELKDPMASMAGGRDREAFPEFYAEYDAASGLGKRLGNRVVVNGPLTYSRQQVARDIQNLKAGVAGAKTAIPSLAGFLPVVAPASALPGAKNEHYKDEETFLTALADALHQEYKAMVDAGLYVQIDDAFLPYMHERMVPPMSNAEYRRWAGMRVDALNHALRASPKSARAITSAGAAGTAPRLRRAAQGHHRSGPEVRVGHYSFEAANPRHAHEWRVWENVKLAPGKI